MRKQYSRFGSALAISLVLLTGYLIAILVSSYNQNLNGTNSKLDDKTGEQVLGATSNITISNQILNFTDQGNSNYLITYRYIISNVGNSAAINLSVNSWFSDTPQNTFTVMSLTTTSSLTLNPNFDGRGDRALLSGTNSMAPNSTAVIQLAISLSYQDRSRQFVNFVDTSADRQASSSTSSQDQVTTTTAAPVSSGGGSGIPGTATTTTNSAPVVSTATSASPGSGGTGTAMYDAAQVSFALPAGGNPVIVTSGKS